jgi:hypothetical protein
MAEPTPLSDEELPPAIAELEADMETHFRLTNNWFRLLATIDALTDQVAALKAERPPEMFKALNGDGPAIPWALISMYEGQAQKNHGQTLKRLAERGGLSVVESAHVLSNQNWRDGRKFTNQQAIDYVSRRIDEWRNAALLERLKASEAERDALMSLNQLRAWIDAANLAGSPTEWIARAREEGRQAGLREAAEIARERERITMALLGSVAMPFSMAETYTDVIKAIEARAKEKQP